MQRTFVNTARPPSHTHSLCTSHQSYASLTKELVPYTGSVYKIVVDDIVLADAFSTVTAAVYDANGNVHGTMTDSIESYVARAPETALNTAIMKFATSAKDYLA